MTRDLWKNMISCYLYFAIHKLYRSIQDMHSLHFQCRSQNLDSM